MAEKTIKLRNATRRMAHFNLEYASFVQAPGKNGVGKPESLTVLARETVEVDEDVLKCREVAAAVRAGSFKVVG